MAPRKPLPPDWEAIKREYRVGQLSVREIARQYKLTEGAIRKRVKAEGWTRDLADEVQKATRERLVRTGTQQDPRARTDEEIVEAAALRGVEVVLGHAKALAEARAMRDQLGRLLSGALGVNGAPSALTVGAGEGERTISLETLCFGKGDGFAALYRAYHDALERVQRLERQTFNIDADDGKGGTGAPPMILDTDQP